jgi:hypothetical protein
MIAIGMQFSARSPQGAIVEAVLSKAMPVILTTVAECSMFSSIERLPAIP